MVSQTPQIEPIVPAYRVRILSDEQLENFKSNTFTILEQTGFHCPSERALKIYAEHGAVVDFDTQIVKLSPDVILEALSHAPRYYTMGGRTEAFDLDLSKGSHVCSYRWNRDKDHRLCDAKTALFHQG